MICNRRLGRLSSTNTAQRNDRQADVQTLTPDLTHLVPASLSAPHPLPPTLESVGVVLVVDYARVSGPIESPKERPVLLPRMWVLMPTSS